ncbi:hypothetical protein A0257_10595 [Hymenobacter psoromatis]|nr:hypothetical protein A0257_10595 [Hymenobacter psoromatis]
MLTFIQNLMPRLRQFSQSLDQTELFVDKPWVLIDEDKQQQTYIFRRSGELLMSLDGQVQIGAWDYIAPAQSLLIDRGADKLLLNHFFFTNALLVLARDGKPESKFILANRQLIPDLNVEKYLEDLDARKTIQANGNLKLNATQQLCQTVMELEDGSSIIFFTVEDNSISVGDAVYTDGNAASDGRYVFKKDGGTNVENGVIKSIFWPQRYKLSTGEQIIADCQGVGMNPKVSDKVFWLSGLPIGDGKYTIINVGKVRIRSGCIDGFTLF